MFLSFLLFSFNLLLLNGEKFVQRNVAQVIRNVAQLLVGQVMHIKCHARISKLKVMLI